MSEIWMEESHTRLPVRWFGFMGTVTSAATVFSTIIYYTPYPVILLIVFSRRSVRASLTT